MKDMYIYELVDPRDNNVRYVGKSNKPKLRYNQHCITRQRFTKTVF